MIKTLKNKIVNLRFKREKNIENLKIELKKKSINLKPNGERG